MTCLKSSFEIMQLPDLLQWIDTASKTGACTFSSRGGTRRVFFRNGRITACTATEPHLLLGQFLLANGMLKEDLLKTLLQIQEHTGRTLGSLILEEGLIEEQDLHRLIAAKAEETIYGLFDLSEVAFRFDPDREPADDSMEVNLDVHNVLLEAAKRTDELNRARQAVSSMNVVPHHTEREPDPASATSYLGNKLYESINGRRTLAEIILLCRTSEYLACSSLLRLMEQGLIRLGEVHEPEAAAGSDSDPTARIRDLVSQDLFAEALDLADCCELQPGHDQYLAMLLAKAEAGFIANVYRTRIPPDAIPQVIHDGNDPVRQEGLSADELFLLEQAEGNWNVRSLAWITPMRKVDLLRSLVKLLDAGLIRLLSEQELPQDSELKVNDGLIVPADLDDLEELDRIL